VRFVREHRVERLWAPDECGSFATMEGPAISLQKTRPRPFGPTQPQFAPSRGVVLRAKHHDGLVYLPARFVVLGIGAKPNAELFDGQLERARDGSLLVDGRCATSHGSGDVYAAGDVATVPSPFLHANVRLGHAAAARAAAAHAARAMIDAQRADAEGHHGVHPDDEVPFDHVPCLVSKILDLNWQFHGKTDGDVVVLGMDTFLSTKVR